VTKWLTAEWFEQTGSIMAELPVRPGLTARIQFEITGGPDGDIACFWGLEDGHLAERGPGVADHPAATVTLGWDDAVAVQRGDLDPNVAFMRGTMKVAGSMAVIMALLPASNTPEVRDLRRRAAELSER
jgi:putative sterol carrier protein